MKKRFWVAAAIGLFLSLLSLAARQSCLNPSQAELDLSRFWLQRHQAATDIRLSPADAEQAIQDASAAEMKLNELRQDRQTAGNAATVALLVTGSFTLLFIVAALLWPPNHPAADPGVATARRHPST